MNKSFSAAKRRKGIVCAVAVLVVLALTCVTAAVILSLPSTLSAVADKASVSAAISSAPASYGATPTPVSVDGSTVMDDEGGYTVKAGQFIRFVGSNDNSKLTFTQPLIVEAEARVIFDVETRFQGSGALTVNGTLNCIKHIVCIIACKCKAVALAVA